MFAPNNKKLLILFGTLCDGDILADLASWPPRFIAWAWAVSQRPSLAGFSFSCSVTGRSGCKDAKCLPPNPLINIWQFESERNDVDKLATQLQILLLVLFLHFPLIGQQRRRSRHSPSPSNGRSRRQSPFVPSAESKPMQTRTVDRRGRTGEARRRRRPLGRVHRDSGPFRVVGSS